MAIYSAPSLSYPTGRSIWLALVLFFMLLLGAVSVGLYSYQTHPAVFQFRWQEGLIAVSWLFAAVGVGQFLEQLKYRSLGSLAWDGFFWHLTSGALDGAQGKPSSQTGNVSIRFDGQRCLLLKFEPSLEGDRAQWLWLERAFAPEHWHDLRRAVYSRAKEPVFNAQH